MRLDATSFFGGFRGSISLTGGSVVLTPAAKNPDEVAAPVAPERMRGRVG
jgi:hypothetical protein